MSRPPSIPSFRSRRIPAFALSLCVGVLFPAGRTCAAPANGCAEVLQQRLHHRRLCRVRRRPVGHGQRHHRHEQSCRANERRAGGRRRAGGLSLLAGRDPGRSRTCRRSRGATFNGMPLNVPLDWDLPPTTVGLGGTRRVRCMAAAAAVYTFRADVQRFLDIDPRTGRRVINKPGGYPVSLPNGGTASAWRQPGRDLSVSGSGDAAERHRPLRRHVREAAVRDPPAADRRLLRSRERARDKSPTLAEARRAAWEAERTDGDRTVRRDQQPVRWELRERLGQRQPNDELTDSREPAFFDTSIAPSDRTVGRFLQRLPCRWGP